jgi:Tfp pilus assembly protein PilW
MRLAAWLATAVLIAGCANAAVGVGTGAVPGTSATSGVAAINTSAGTTALGLVLILGTIDYVNNPQPFPDPSAFFYLGEPPAPVLAPNRRVTEQDCSKPIDLTQGNLRCK